MIRLLISALLLAGTIDRSYQRTRQLSHDSPLLSLKQESISTTDTNVDNEDSGITEVPITQPPSDLIDVAPRKQPLSAAVMANGSIIQQTLGRTTEIIEPATNTEVVPDNRAVNKQPSVSQQILNVKHIVPDQPTPFRTSNSEVGNPDSENINEENIIRQPNVASIPSAPGFPPGVANSQQQPFNVGLGPQLAPASGQWSRTPNGLSRTALTVQDVEKLSGLNLNPQPQRPGGDSSPSNTQETPEVEVPATQNLSAIAQAPKHNLGAVNNSSPVVRQPFGIVERPVGPFGQIPDISITKEPANKFNLPPAQQPQQAKGIIVPRITADGITTQVLEQSQVRNQNLAPQ